MQTQIHVSETFNSADITLQAVFTIDIFNALLGCLGAIIMIMTKTLKIQAFMCASDKSALLYDNFNCINIGFVKHDTSIYIF